MEQPASMQQPSDTSQTASGQAMQQAGVDLEKVKKTVTSNLSRMLRFRRPYDPVWFKWFRQYISSRDQKMFPDGLTPRANTVVPYAYSNVETVVSRTMDAFFSVRPFFECNGRGEQDEPAAEKMTVVLTAKLHAANFPQTLELLTRNIATYGVGAVKVDWDWGYDMVTYPQQVPVMVPVVDPQSGQPVPNPADPSTPLMQQFVHPLTGQPQFQVKMQTKPVAHKRPKFYVIDVYDLLVDPDGGMIAHLVERTFGDLKREAAAYQEATGKTLYFPDALAELETKLAQEEDPDSVIVRIAEFWNAFDNTRTLITFAEDKDAVGWKDQRYAARTGSSYSPYKRKMYVGQPILLDYGDNPFAHRRVPIVFTSYVKMPNEQYGIGVIESAGDLNEALNQMVSMIRDNWNVGINHRFVYDTTMDVDHEALNNANVPGGKVGVSGDPTKAIFPLPTFTPNPGDYSLMELYKNQIELATGISDFYSKAVGGPGSNATATGITSIINESNYRFRMFIRNLELDVVQPLLEMCAANIQQFITDQDEVLITESNPAIPKYMTVQPEQLLGGFQFDLVAANYATNEVVRQRNMMALMQILSQSPFIDQFEATKLLLKTFKIPDYASLLKSPQQVEMEQQQQMQQQMQMMLLEHEMDIDKIQAGAEAKAKANGEGGGNKPTGGKNGRPRSPMMPEGKMPGTGATGPIRQIAQQQGLNGLGLEGLGQR